jgi:heptosyltransferase III
VSALWTGFRRGVLRPARLATELLHGDALRRHRARADLRAMRHRLAWAWKRVARERKEPSRPTILIGMIEHFGDIVAAEPVARYVRRQHPEAYLVWAVASRFRELIDSNPHVDAALPMDCLTEWIGFRDTRSFDQIIDLQIHGRFCETCYVLLEQPEDRRAIDLDNYYDHGCLLEVFCRSAGLPVLREAPHVYIPEASRSAVDALRLPSRFVAIHATSNQASRDWAADKWQQLVERITIDLGVPVVEVGLQPMVGPDTPGYTSLCGRLSLLETAEVIRRAETFVGIDSGPAHLANAVGTYGVILLGHYAAFTRYMPYSGEYGSGANADVIHADGPATTIPVERVLAPLEARLGSLPNVSVEAR